MLEMHRYYQKLKENQNLENQFIELARSGPFIDSNNRYQQYRQSIWGKHTTPHGWLRLFLNLKADLLDSNRHWYLPKRSPILESNKSRVGILPMISSAYYLLMKDSRTLPNIPKDTSEFMALKMIQHALNATFRKKHIFIAPGRAGYEAKFILPFRPASIGVLTSGDYLTLAKKILTRRQDTAIPTFIIPAKIENILVAVAPHRPDIASLLTGTKLHKRNTRLPVSNIVFVTNMYNNKRFDSPKSEHFVPVTWQTSLKRILATGQPGSRFIITPAIDFEPVFTKREILQEIGTYSRVSFFRPEINDPSVASSAGDFVFIVELTKPVPKSELNLY